MVDIVFETSRFSIAEASESTGPSAPSKSLVQWLIQSLQAHGVEEVSNYPEGSGWELEARHGSTVYFVAVQSSAADSHTGAIWRISVRKQRSLLEKALGKNRMSPTDPLLWMIESALHAEKDITNVRRESTAA